MQIVLLFLQLTEFFIRTTNIICNKLKYELEHQYLRQYSTAGQIDEVNNLLSFLLVMCEDLQRFLNCRSVSLTIQHVLENPVKEEGNDHLSEGLISRSGLLQSKNRNKPLSATNLIFSCINRSGIHTNSYYLTLIQ